MIDNKIVDIDRLSKYHVNLNVVLDNKQDIIDNLDVICEGAGKGATSVQGIKVNGTTITRKDENGAIDIGYNEPYRAPFSIVVLQGAVENGLYYQFPKDEFVTAFTDERPLEIPISRGSSTGIPASYYGETTADGKQIIVDVIHGTKVYHLVLNVVVEQSFFVIGPDNTTCKDTSEVYITPYTLNEFAAANGRYLSVSKEFVEAAYNKKMILIPTGKTVANGYYVVATHVEASDPTLETCIYLAFNYNFVLYRINLSTITVAPAEAYCNVQMTEFVSKDMWNSVVYSDNTIITRPNTQVDVYSIDGASFTRNGAQTAMTPNTVYEFTDNGVKRTIAVYDDHKLVITSADDVAFEYPITYKSSERVLPSKLPSSLVTQPELREAIEEVTPDWDSEGGDGFIKNRTHFAGLKGVFNIGDRYSLLANTGTHSPESYRLRYKGELYKLPSVGETAFYPNEDNAAFHIELRESTSGSTTTYRISSTVINEDVAGTEVEVVADYMSKKIDDFYIPDTIARKGDLVTTLVYKATSKVENTSNPWSDSTFGAHIIKHNYDDTLKEGVIYFDGRITTIGYGAFENCSSLTSVAIPDSVTTIGRSAFSDCRSLTSITIPDSVTTIGHGAFRDCSSLTSVYCKATTPTAGNSYMFYGNAYGRKIYVPMESVEAYKTTQWWSDYADDIVGEGNILEALTSDEISEIYFNNFNINVYFGSGASGDGISAALTDESENIEEPIDESSIE